MVKRDLGTITKFSTKCVHRKTANFITIGGKRSDRSIRCQLLLMIPRSLSPAGAPSSATVRRYKETAYCWKNVNCMLRADEACLTGDFVTLCVAILNY